MSFGTGSEPVADPEVVAELYACHAVRVRRLVRLDVTGSDAVVEDACQVAWMRLLAHRARVQRAGAVRWVVQVARREAWRQLARGARERPLEALEAVEHDVGQRSAAPDLADSLLARREQVEAIRALPERQRRAVWLQGLGFSYAEIAGTTGDSRRTVERQLERARRSLARAESAA